MSEIIIVYEVYEKDGGGVGNNQGTLGVFPTEEAAKSASQKLGHPFFGIQSRYALKLGTDVYLLENKGKPFTLGELAMRA